MEGAVELAEEIFHMPVRLGTPQGVRGLADVVRNPIYSTSVGLLLYGLQKQSEGTPMSDLEPFLDEPDEYQPKPPKPSMLGRLKGWIQGNF